MQYGARLTGPEEKPRIEIYIDSSEDTDWNKTLFDKLMEHRNHIESELSESLEWERQDEHGDTAESQFHTREALTTIRKN